MCSKSFLTRWEMYFKAKGEAPKGVKAESPMDTQHAVGEIASPIVEDSKMKDVDPDPDMSKPIRLST